MIEAVSHKVMTEIKEIRPRMWGEFLKNVEIIAEVVVDESEFDASVKLFLVFVGPEIFFSNEIFSVTEMVTFSE